MRGSWVFIHLGLQTKQEDLCICVSIACSSSLNYGQWMQMIWHMKALHIFHYFTFRWQMKSLVSHGEVLVSSALRDAWIWMNAFSSHTLWAFFLKLVIFGAVSGGGSSRMGYVPASGALKLILLLFVGWELYSSFSSAHTGCWQLNCGRAYSFLRLLERVLASCWDSSPMIPAIQMRVVSGFIGD